MAGLQCQFTGAWRGGFLHCWPAQAELCLPELQESFSSGIFLENPTQAEERVKKKKKKGKFVQIHLAEVQTSWEILAVDRRCRAAFLPRLFPTLTCASSCAPRRVLLDALVGI